MMSLECQMVFVQLLTSVDTQLLLLTPIDDDVYCKFRFDFPELAVDVVSETALKSEDAKAVSIVMNNVFY